MHLIRSLVILCRVVRSSNVLSIYLCVFAIEYPAFAVRTLATIAHRLSDASLLFSGFYPRVMDSPGHCTCMAQDQVKKRDHCWTHARD